MFNIQPGEEVTLAGPVFQGAWGILGGTRCRVLNVAPPTKPEAPVILTLMPLPATNGLALRVPAHETMEGIINILEERSQNLESDVMTALQGLDSIQEKHPEAAKAVLEYCLLKMRPAGRNLALNRPDKKKVEAAPTPASAPTAPSAPAPEKK